MTLNELIERLQEVAENGHGEKEVLVAIQPNYPLAVELEGVADPNDLEDEDNDLMDPAEPDPKASTSYVWLSTGSGAPRGHSPYASSDVFAVAN